MADTAAPRRAFFGCADVKCGAGGAVAVLELGDGHTSGFTGAGAGIPGRFTELGFVRAPVDVVLDTVVENKALTHDAFLDAGWASLRPKAGIFPMVYSADLARRVAEAAGPGRCVLKLCARQRGCGVVIADVEDLDATLRALLAWPVAESEPDAGAAGPAAWAERAAKAAARRDLEEHVAHWRADEHGCFLAEALCESERVPGPDGAAFDGTLRVGFALEEDGGAAHLLGAYWKLPDAAADDPRAALADRCVSHTHGGSGTASCTASAEAAVWRALGPALPQVLRQAPAGAGASWFADRYAGAPLLRAAALVRAGGCACAEGRRSDAAKSLQGAREALAELPAGDPAAARLWGYARRQAGTLAVRRAGGAAWDWKAGAELYEEAALAAPGNAAAAYLRGMALFAARRYCSAGVCFARSIEADCDFASAYVQLAACCLLLGHPEPCQTVAQALLSRRGKIAAAHHLIASALFAEEAKGGGCHRARRESAARHLELARELQKGRSWSAEDDRMLETLRGDAPLVSVPIRTWLFHAWRL